MNDFVSGLNAALQGKKTHLLVFGYFAVQIFLMPEFDLGGAAEEAKIFFVSTGKAWVDRAVAKAFA